MNKMTAGRAAVKGIDFLGLALWAFAGLGIEAAYAFLLEPRIYGRQMPDWTGAQTISHWLITCLTWGIIIYRLVNTSRRKYSFDPWAEKRKVRGWQWSAVILLSLISFYVSYRDWDGFKALKEFQNLGLLKFIFQYIYYLFETVLFTLIIVFGQRAFELWFQSSNFPYGGMVLALTWGLAHIFSRGDILAGVFTALSGFIYGAVYLLLGRDLKKALPFLILMFVL